MRPGVAEQYLWHLRERDGVLDPSARTLSLRESLLKRIERSGVRSRTRVEPELFQRNYERRQPDKRLDERVLWLLLLAKIKRGELYRAERRLQGIVIDRVDAYFHVEAVYHARMIVEILRCFQLDTKIGQPSAFHRGLVHTVEKLPASWREPIAFNCQAMSVTVMQLIRKRGHQLFADSPMLLERVEALLAEMVLDGAGQTAYRHAQLDGAGRKRAEKLLPFMMRLMAYQLPHVGLLFGVDKVHARVKALDPYALRALQPHAFSSELSAA
jgi:hypothetical protein